MLKRLSLFLLRLYQRGISPYTQPHCNYVPTCSAYAVEAVSRFGAIGGGILALWRLLRCNPLSRGGYDPVPDHFTLHREYKVYALPPRLPFLRKRRK